MKKLFLLVILGFAINANAAEVEDIEATEAAAITTDDAGNIIEAVDVKEAAAVVPPAVSDIDVDENKE